jgi:hypothetical protein
MCRHTHVRTPCTTERVCVKLKRSRYSRGASGKYVTALENTKFHNDTQTSILRVSKRRPLQTKAQRLQSTEDGCISRVENTGQQQLATATRTSWRSRGYTGMKICLESTTAHFLELPEARSYCSYGRELATGTPGTLAVVYICLATPQKQKIPPFSVCQQGYTFCGNNTSTNLL